MNLEEHQSLYEFFHGTMLVTGELGSEIACALVGCHAHIVILNRDRVLAQEARERFPKVVKEWNG